MKITFLLIFFYTLNAQAILIAHRGVHQTYSRQGVTDETCTAKTIHKTEHQYLENTIDSMITAFEMNADAVEIDIHPTTESYQEQLVVFHDYGLKCRTDASCTNGCDCIRNSKKQKVCLTHMQSYTYLQGLDIGFGYTYDKGKTYPLRDRRGEMPLLVDVLNLISKPQYINKNILINVKGNFDRTTTAFMREIKNHSLEVRSRVHYPYRYGDPIALEKLGIKDEILQNAEKCFVKYLKVGLFGKFPEECRNKQIFVPIKRNFRKKVGPYWKTY